MLVNAGLTTFKKIQDTNPREIELVGPTELEFCLFESLCCTILEKEGMDGLSFHILPLHFNVVFLFRLSTVIHLLEARSVDIILQNLLHILRSVTGARPIFVIYYALTYH